MQVHCMCSTAGKLHVLLPYIMYMWIGNLMANCTQWGPLRSILELLDDHHCEHCWLVPEFADTISSRGNLMVMFLTKFGSWPLRIRYTCRTYYIACSKTTRRCLGVQADKSNLLFHCGRVHEWHALTKRSFPEVMSVVWSKFNPESAKRV